MFIGNTSSSRYVTELLNKQEQIVEKSVCLARFALVSTPYPLVFAVAVIMDIHVQNYCTVPVLKAKGA